MVENIILSKLGNESEDASRTIYQSSSEWTENGANLVVYKNGQLQINPRDYTVLDATNIQFTSSLTTTETVSMMISNLTIETKTKIDRVYKKLENKTQTSIEKEVFEETISSNVIIHTEELWTSPIDENPSNAIAADIAEFYNKFELTEDLTVANQMGYYPSINEMISGIIHDWIQPRFGLEYTIRLYDNNGIEIPSSHPMRWRWDYSAGYLFIENDHSFQTPFKFSGYRYIGTTGLGSSETSYWKPPVPYNAALPIVGNNDGDIRVTLSNNSLWRWNTEQNEWIPASAGNYKSPVNTFDDLSLENNSNLDIRLVVDEKKMYFWDEENSIWEPLVYDHEHDDRYYTESEIDNLLNTYSINTHTHGSLYYLKPEVDSMVRWRPSVATTIDLPPHTENRDGDVILTRDFTILWRWVTSDPNTGQGEWIDILTHALFWKEPVSTLSDLQFVPEIIGHVHLVLDIGEPYYWDGTQWLSIGVGDHEHDDRYYIKNEIDVMFYWKAPVDDYSSLPIIDNVNGDARITLDTNNIYKWNGTDWQLISASTTWRETVNLLVDLPINGNASGDTRIVLETMLIYRFNEVSNLWEVIGVGPHDHDDRYYTENELNNGQLDGRYYTEQEVDEKFDTDFGHDHDGINSKKIDYNDLLNIPTFTWLSPVQVVGDLPTADNNLGDAIIVLDESSIYAWDGANWIMISSGQFQVHDHDERYYTEQEINTIISNLQLWLTGQLALKANLNHIHDDRYYTETEIDDRFDTNTGHDHDGINSSRISYYDLINVPPLESHEHDYDDRYYTKTDLQTPGNSIVDWNNISNSPNFAGQWKTPVQDVADLPDVGNDVGDIRVVLSDSDVYEWNGVSWNFVGHWEIDTAYWKPPVEEYSDLPAVNNVDGDIRLVLTENILYRWSEVLEAWIVLLASSSSFQIYLNGVQLLEGEEWIRTKESGVTLLEPAKMGDKVTLIIQGNNYLRKDFDAYEGQILFETFNYFYREEFVIQNNGQITINLTTPYVLGSSNLLVWLNGIIQKVNEDYIENHSTQFTFNHPLLEDDRVIVIITEQAMGVGGYIREDQVPSLANQKIFTLNNIFAMGTNSLLVYLNGNLLRVEDDYEEISTSEIETSLELDPSDFLTFIIFSRGAIGGGAGECCNAANVVLGTPTDTSWLDGLIMWWNSQYKVNDAIDDINEVLKEIAPAPPVNFNNRDLIPEGLFFYSGYESDFNTNYEGSAGDYHIYLTENESFKLFTPNDDSFGQADYGIMIFYLNGSIVDSFDLSKAFVINDQNSSQSALNYGILANGARGNEGVLGTNGAIRNSLNGYISIMEVTKYNEFKMWQRGIIRININNGILRSGYNYMRVEHNLGTTQFTTNILKLFFDTSNSRPELGPTITCELENIYSTKYLSGVRYYTIGDEFRSSFIGYGIFNNTYKQIPATLNMPGLQEVEVEFDDSNTTGKSNPPANGDLFNFNGVITLDDYDVYNINARLRVSTFDPFGAGDTNLTSTVGRLVNTYTNGSNDLKEFFRDEQFRLPLGDYNSLPITRTNIWNSETLLNDGEALIFDLKLKYPNINFTTGYKPTPQLANYEGFTDEFAFYVRSFYQSSPHNSGTFVLEGLNETMLRNEDVRVLLKLPSQTGWMSLNEDYDVVTFLGDEGDGCLLNVNGNEFTYSSGTFSTANSDFMILMMIVMQNTSPEISYIELLW